MVSEVVMTCFTLDPGDTGGGAGGGKEGGRLHRRPSCWLVAAAQVALQTSRILSLLHDAPEHRPSAVPM